MSAKALEKWGQITPTIEKYGDIGNFSGVTYVILPFVILKFVGTWAPTAKMIGDIPDFNVLIVPKTQPRHNPAKGPTFHIGLKIPTHGTMDTMSGEAESKESPRSSTFFPWKCISSISSPILQMNEYIINDQCEQSFECNSNAIMSLYAIYHWNGFIGQAQFMYGTHGY